MAVTPDLVDAATLAQLEKSARIFIEALRTAGPAYDRLEAAHYGGIDHIICWGETEEELDHLIESLEDFRLAQGDQAAADYRFLMLRLGLDLASAIAELVGMDSNNLPRVEPFIRYAQSVA